ncbi:MAG: hypothetical protein LM565_03040 [Thermofilum sp.]|nr:hypothetical protein [Thermofilum sp.]
MRAPSTSTSAATSFETLEVFRPPSHGYREEAAAALRSYADRPGLGLRELAQSTPVCVGRYI